MSPTPPTQESPQTTLFTPKGPVKWPGFDNGNDKRNVGITNRVAEAPLSEEAVMNALRWYVTKQNADGSWGEGGNRTAMTGLALLCFLAHGEVPSRSEEFGETVRRGLEFLVDGILPDGTFAVRDGNNYSHAIATYALCEAYVLTMNPMLREAAERALVPLILGQHPNGGWDYGLAQTDRDDTSFMGWCAQAVKAGYAAGLDVPGLEQCYRMIAPGMKVNFGMADKNRGGFGYTTPDANSGLTAVGVLALQLTGNAKDPAARAGLNTMDAWTVGWKDGSFGTHSGAGQYYFYYATQCMYNEGGNRWKRWDDRMNPAYTMSQTIIPAMESGYVDHTGKARAIGFWKFEEPPHVETGGIFDTALVTLQLEIYYRFMTTYSRFGFVAHEAKEALPDSDDGTVTVRF
ncbi:MAG: terpene cyclase/mutase family protein [Kiritimatiellaeota bacterium]|nr:terpene cyclase/mutase family protein [Kiritimatiellota bacterium]